MKVVELRSRRIVQRVSAVFLVADPAAKYLSKLIKLTEAVNNQKFFVRTLFTPYPLYLRGLPIF